MARIGHIWRVVVCEDCHDEVIQVYKDQARLKYAYATRAVWLRDASGALADQDKVWFAFDVATDLAGEDERLEVVCRCKAREGSQVEVRLDEVIAAAKRSTGRNVPLTAVTCASAIDSQ